MANKRHDEAIALDEINRVVSMLDIHEWSHDLSGIIAGLIGRLESSDQESAECYWWMFKARGLLEADWSPSTYVLRRK